MTSKIKNTTIVCGLVLIVCLVLGVFLTATPINMAYATTTELTECNYDEEFIVTDTANEVKAIFMYTRINETECSVSLANKSEATKAIIPASAEIDGKKYTVTEVATNGFTSSPNLVRVTMPPTIKKIGSSAFANCAVLSRVALANAKEIGNNVFFKCPKLDYLFVPESVDIIGSSILRGNDTQVKARAKAAGKNWSTNWNANNSNQNVIFDSDDKEPLELCTIYSDIVTYSSESPTVVAYALDGGQPRTDEFYHKDENNNIFVPQEYKGIKITQIMDYAFYDSAFSQFIVEYSEEEITIGSSAFWQAKGTSVTINRPVNFYSLEDESPAENVFTESTLEAIVLPNNITEITQTMFYDCKKLTNVFFKEPIDCSDNESLNIVKDLLFTESESGEETRVPAEVYLPKSIERIGEAAFYGTISIADIHIYSSMSEVGARAFAQWTEGQTITINNEDDFGNWNIDWSSYSNAKIEYTIATYTITFHFDDETGTTEIMEIKYGNSIGDMPTSQKDYNTFISWVDSDNHTWTEDSIYDINDDLHLYPQYTPFKLKVKYSGNSPDENEDPVQGTMNETVLDYDETLVLRELGYSIRGWDFEYWSVTDGNRIMKFDYKNEKTVTMLKLFQYFDLEVGDGKSITFDANWKLHEYEITYNVGEGTNPSENKTSFTIKTPTFTFLLPIREGYIGSWDRDGVEKGSTAEDITVTASYVVDEIYVVDYDLNGGVEYKNPREFRTKEDNPLNNPTRLGYSFIGWRVKGTVNRFVTNLKGLENELILEAIWVQTGTEYTISTTMTDFTVDSAISTIEIPNVYCNLEIKVPANVEQLYLYAKTYNIYSVRLTIQNGRTSDFSLILNNVCIRSDNPQYSTINMQDDYALIITAYKKCAIQGATGIRGEDGTWDREHNIGINGTAGGNGGIAIECIRLTICSPISIIGGKGGDGGNGYSSGFYGGRGSAPGSGNYAIVAIEILLQSSEITIRGGDGGKGGDGGYGSNRYGLGAHGGSGKKAISATTSGKEIEDLPIIIGVDDYDNITIADGTYGEDGYPSVRI